MFAVIYAGCKCGETWRVHEVEDIDCDNDRVESRLVCTVCGQDVSEEKKTPDGKVVVHILSEEEMDEYRYLPDDDEGCEDY